MHAERHNREESGMSNKGIEMKYFVLKPAGDNPYSSASRKAMRAYASQIQEENEDLCSELRAWADSETPDLMDKME